MIRPIARSAVLTCALGAFALGACGSDDNGADSTSAADTSVGESTPAVTEAPPAVTDEVSVPATVDGTTAAPATDVAQSDVAVTEAPAGPPAADAGLTIVDFSFSAANVPAATEFTLTNDDEFAHTVTDRDGAFDVRVEGAATAPLTIERAGTYEIFCRIHPSMSGTITVV